MEKIKCLFESSRWRDWKFNSRIFISSVFFSRCWQTAWTWISRGKQCCELNVIVIFKYRSCLTQSHDFHQDLREIFRRPILNPRSWCLNASIWRKKRQKTFAKDYIWVVGHGRAAWLTKVQSPTIANGSCRHLKVSLICKPKELHTDCHRLPGAGPKSVVLAAENKAAKLPPLLKSVKLLMKMKTYLFFCLTSGNRDFHITVVDDSLGYLI